ncbi:MAG: hypothetical protein Kow0027_14990 [Saprospiraceae bacterium]
MKKIICIHLYNDYSGSPLVLSTSIKNLVKRGFEVEVLTSKGTTGFLSGIKGVRYRNFRYRFYDNKLLRLGMLLWSQLTLFVMMARYRNTGSVVYINTLLPFGAALGAKLWNLRVVYHMHETTVNPPILKRFLKAVARRCASGAIYVSRFLQRAEPLAGVPSTVVYNSLDAEFVKQALDFRNGRHQKPRSFTALMLCSLKAYKGVDVYVRLAAKLSQYQFLLVLNSDMESIRQYFADTDLPQNLVIFPSAKSVHSFYEEAHLVLNLSHPLYWVETFGMTLLEGMQYGLPVIGPPVGGPAEIIRDGYNGFQVDQRNFDSLVDKVNLLATDQQLYDQMAANAADFASNFNEEKFVEGVINALSTEKVQQIPSVELAA